jgi:hypothetical protein
MLSSSLTSYSDTLDIMDEFPNMKGFHIVMDNAPIHPKDVVDPVTLQRGYIPVYLPPYSGLLLALNYRPLLI